MPPSLPTRVRHSESESRSLLQAYVTGGRYGPQRVPRGIDPRLAVEFLRNVLRPDESPLTFRRGLDVALFYESAGAVDAFIQPLALELLQPDDLERAALGAQAAGNLGTTKIADEAARAIDMRVVPHPAARAVFPELIEARLALAPSGTDAALEGRIRAETALAKKDEETSEAAMVAYDQLAALERNGIPRLQAQEAEKLRLAALPRPQRTPELVALYLGLARFGGPFLDVWAARLLRAEAMSGADMASAFAELERHAAAADPAGQGVRAWFRIVRAAQAIVYLGGQPSPELQSRWDEGASYGGQSFLWDDP